MLWFGLRKRLAALTRAFRALERQVTELAQLRATMAASVASVENATDKLNRVVERRRKQMAYEDGLEDDDDDDGEFYDLLEEKRRAPLTPPGASDAEA